MPFAGELIQVRDEERDWEGAAERLLRGFGLSLLVPDAHYAAVGDWVDRTHLQRPAGLLPRAPGAGRAASCPTCIRDSLVRKLVDQAGFAVLRLAGARAGAPLRLRLLRQRRISSAARRGPSRAPARSRARASATRRTTATASTTAAATCSAGRNAGQDRRAGGEGPRSCRPAWARSASASPQLQTGAAERCASGCEALDTAGGVRRLRGARLAQRSPTELAALQRRDAAAGSGVRRAAGSSTAQLRRRCEAGDRPRPSSTPPKDGAPRSNRRSIAAEAEQAQTQARASSSRLHARRLRGQRALRADRRLARRGAGRAQLTVESCDNREQDMRALAAGAHRRRRQEARAPAREDRPAMTELQGAVPARDARGRRQRRGRRPSTAPCWTSCSADDLPRFEARFKELLNENTIREVANFQSQLHRERETIRNGSRASTSR